MRRKFLNVVTSIITFAWLCIGVLLPTHAFAKNDSVHVHIKGATESVSEVIVVYNGTEITLEQKSGSLFSVPQPGDIVKPDISTIIVKRTDGTLQQFSPASQYAGVEGKGTINYWIEVKPTSSPKPENPGTKQPPQPQPQSGPQLPTAPTNNNTSANTATPTTLPTAASTTGQLPDTATPWYNLLAISCTALAASGLVWWKLKKSSKPQW